MVQDNHSRGMVTLCAPRETLSGCFPALQSIESPSLNQGCELEHPGAAPQPFHSPTKSVNKPPQVGLQQVFSQVELPHSGIRETTCPKMVSCGNGDTFGRGLHIRFTFPKRRRTPFAGKHRNPSGGWKSGEMQKSWEWEASPVIGEEARISQGLHGDWIMRVLPRLAQPGMGSLE